MNSTIKSPNEKGCTIYKKRGLIVCNELNQEPVWVSNSKYPSLGILVDRWTIHHVAFSLQFLSSFFEVIDLNSRMAEPRVISYASQVDIDDKSSRGAQLGCMPSSVFKFVYELETNVRVELDGLVQVCGEEVKVINLDVLHSLTGITGYIALISPGLLSKGINKQTKILPFRCKS